MGVSKARNTNELMIQMQLNGRATDPEGEKKKGGFLLRAYGPSHLFIRNACLDAPFCVGQSIESPVTGSGYVAQSAGAIISNPDCGMQRNGKFGSVRFDRARGWNY